MSNIYVTEPPYSGKVVLETNKGDIEIELFSKECPQTCKNFIALALEGYYDNLIWHRIVPNFIIQSGDPTGTGLGGESFYGQSFTDEFHQRLRFNRRGLLGMANASTPNSNDSQFFLTLASTPELQARHTMFGRISGNTIYNLVNLAESAGEIGEGDRPAFPPKLKTVRVLENPFEGEIELRITREERAEIKKNKREAARRKSERDNDAVPADKKKKNTALLSFGQEEDVREDEVLKGPKSSHDLLRNDKRLKAEAIARPLPDTIRSVSSNGIISGIEEREPKRRRKEERVEAKSDLGKIREERDTKSKPSSSADKIAELEAELRGANKKIDKSDDVSQKAGRGKDLLQEYRDKYKQTTSSKVSKRRDEDTALLLSSFQKRLRAEAAISLKEKRRKEEAEAQKIAEEEEGDIPDDLREYGDSDEDTDWRNHKFDFGGKAIANDGHDQDEYVTLDPRDTTSSKASLLGFGGSEGAKRAKEEKAREGRRGRDWVDERVRDTGRRREERGKDRRDDRDHHHHTSSIRREHDAPRAREHLERW